ncbi:MAG: divalent-cation tolerance protein CutA [Pseudomonadota bacterium]
MLLVQVNCGSLDEAHHIAETVVGERLAAGANIISQAHSIYRWQGEVVSDPECVIWFKTREAMFDKMAERIKVLHSYNTPCIIGTTIQQGDQAYMDWLTRETGG